jgi:hypothetical protein
LSRWSRIKFPGKPVSPVQSGETSTQ